MIKGDLAQEFRQILNRLSEDYTLDETLRYLKGLGRDHILQFESEVGLASAAESIYVSDTYGMPFTRELAHYSVMSYITHSATRPAAGEDYYLFNLYFTQAEWFTILGYTEEEQLAHILKWGRHS